MGVFNYNNPFIVFMVRLANMMIVSFYWVLCCIPVVTVLPASAALYHCVTRVVMARGSGVTRDFFRSFRAALKPGIGLTVIAEIVGILVYIGFQTGLRIWDVSLFGTIYMALGVLVVILCVTMLIYVPPVLSRFEGGMGIVLRLSMYFSGRRLFASIWYALLLAMGIWFVDFFPPALFVIPALYTDLIRGGVEKSMKRYIEEAGLLDAEEVREEKNPTDDTPSALELEKMLTGEGNHG